MNPMSWISHLWHYNHHHHLRRYHHHRQHQQQTWSSQPPWLTLLIVIWTMLPAITEGCYRKPAIRTTTTAAPTTTINPSHKLDCKPEELFVASCRNGGTCFAIELDNNIRTIGCNCPEEWFGNQCEYRSIDPTILAKREMNIRTAHIAAGVSVCILVLFCVLLGVYVCVRKYKKENARSVNLQDPERQSLKQGSPRPGQGESSHDGAGHDRHNNHLTGNELQPMNSHHETSPKNSQSETSL